MEFMSFFLFFLLACESEELTTLKDKTVTTKRVRFTRRSTTTMPTIDKDTTKFLSSENLNTIIDALTESTDTKDNETLKSIESSVVTGSPPEPSIAVEIVTKKSLRVRNCGERIGDDIPFIAVLVHTNPFEKNAPKKKKSLSKGVLISENFVMATVSSVYHSESFWTVSSVRLGDFVTWNKYASRDKSNSLEVEVDEIFYHKKKDLALIKLKESVTFTDTIRPACLPLSDSYNFKELQSHLCKRSHNKGPADVTLEFAV
jgi:Trypsin